MKYIKKFESRYKNENINKKYYVWKIRGILGLIEIVSVINFASIFISD